MMPSAEEKPKRIKLLVIKISPSLASMKSSALFMMGEGLPRFIYHNTAKLEELAHSIHSNLKKGRQ